jgi:hypothetical protein
MLTEGATLEERTPIVRGSSELTVTVRGQVCFVGNGPLRLPNPLLQRTASGSR